MLKILQEYEIPVKKLLPLGSARSAGKMIAFNGEEIPVQEATDDSFNGMD